MKKKANFFRMLTQLSPNTFIGGVSSYITSEADLASYLSISSSDIKSFTITGDDISCYIGVNYTINSHAFEIGGSFDWGGGDIMTCFWDTDGNCTEFGIDVFRQHSSIRNLYFPSVTSIIGIGVFFLGSSTTNRFLHFPNLTAITSGNECFRNCDYCIIVMPELTQLGATVGVDNVFLNTDNATVYVDVSLATNNSSNPDGDLGTLISGTGNTINYSDNNTAPSSISDLAVDTTYSAGFDISWTAPSSTNSIDKYAVFVDYILQTVTTSTSYTISGLDENTTYNIQVLTIDIEGNTSFSNVLTETTNSYVIPTGNIVSYWNFDSNSNDQVGSNNGTDTSISYVSSGGIGNVADFTAGVTSNIEIADAADLSFGNGTTDSAFSISLRVKVSSFVSQFQLIGKRDSSNANKEYHVWILSNKINFRLFDQSSGAQLNCNSNISLVVNTWYSIICTYDGSGSVGGMNVYVNSNSDYGTSTSGTYTAMENGTGTLMVGKLQSDTIYSLNGYMDEVSIFDKELSSTEVYDIYNKNRVGQYLTQ